VVVEGQRVRAATAAAGRVKIRAGMTVSEARSRCADLQVLPWDEVVIGGEVVRATAAFVAASPHVTPAAGAPGLWWIGATGFEPVGGEAELVRALSTRARQWHPRARVGIADSCVAARAATWEREEVTRGATIVPSGGCAAYLARAPLGMLSMDEDLAESLRALGLRTIGELAQLLAEDVERRWGDVGLAAWRLAHGDDDRRPGLLRLDPHRAVTTELCPSVSTTEPLLFLARSALERLLTGLIADGRAAAVVAVTLALDDVRNALPVPTRTHTITREIRLPRPVARLVPLHERCRTLLDDWPLSAPVRALTIAITATAPLSGAQGDLLDPSWRDPAAAEAAFARLRSTLGTDSIARPVLHDTHRPEAAAIWERSTEGHDVDHRTATPRSVAPPRPPSPFPSSTIAAPAFRHIDPPEPIEVTIADDRPRALRWRNRWVRVQHALGPERLTGDWWDAPYARDYWRCEDAETGTQVMVYHELSAPSHDQWFVQGWYD
jgi:protein ImuB